MGRALARLYAHVVDDRTGSGWRIPALDDDRCNTIMELLMAPAASAVVLGVARSGSLFLEYPIMRFVSFHLFSLYLWHLVVIRVVPVPDAIKHAFVPRLAYTLAVSLVVALGSYLFVERQF
ncbi:MAG TPA: hypothetical protein VGL61_17230 [Kofleriaceae bacterium]|jgi:peptidoglycan/LPS O-acetylase OafA/YrhL